MDRNPTPTPIVFWILWFAISSGLVIIYLFMSPGVTRETTGLVRYVPILPLLISAFIRWLLLPKADTHLKALPLFLIGLATAEACGLLGIFLAPDLKQTYLILALLGLAQFVPFFASKLR